MLAKYNRTASRAKRNRPRGTLQDAGWARDRLRELHADGASDRQVAAETGLHRRAIAEVRTGRVRRMRAETQTRILQVTGRPQSPQALVDAGATRAWLDWLAEQGTTTAWPRARLGGDIRPERICAQRSVTRATEQGVATLARQVGAGLIHPPGVSAATDELPRRREQRARARAS
jgi:hypothetical protein